MSVTGFLARTPAFGCKP